MNATNCPSSHCSTPDKSEKSGSVQDVSVGGRKVGLVLMTVNTDVEYKRKISLEEDSMMPPPTFCFNFPQHLEEQKRAFDHGKSCLITATLAHYGWGGGGSETQMLRRERQRKRNMEGRTKERKIQTDQYLWVSRKHAEVKKARAYSPAILFSIQFNQPSKHIGSAQGEGPCALCLFAFEGKQRLFLEK